MNIRDHLTDSEAVCFRSVFVFVKVVIVDQWGRRIDTHTLLLSMLRDLCVRWSFGRCVFFGTRYTGLVNVLPESTPHYQIVNLESLFFSCLSC